MKEQLILLLLWSTIYSLYIFIFMALYFEYDDDNN
jgi:hypothetical protein